VADDQEGQSGAGKTKLIIKPCLDDKLCFTLDDGKDRASTKFTFKRTGTDLDITFTSGGVTGLAQTVTRAQVEAAISESTNETVRDVLKSLLPGLL